MCQNLLADNPVPVTWTSRPLIRPAGATSHRQFQLRSASQRPTQVLHFSVQPSSQLEAVFKADGVAKGSFRTLARMGWHLPF